MRIVSPYREFPIVRHSQEGFDWLGAMAMLRASAKHVMNVPVCALTTRETPISGDAFVYPTQERSLMLWILEVSLAYLSSAQFDCNTIMLSPDTLVAKDLRPYFHGDLTILVRPLPKYEKRPVLNCAQWWPVQAKDKLVAFYTHVLATARALPRSLQKWGADCEAIRLVLDPIEPGLATRGGLRVWMQPYQTVMRTVNQSVIRLIRRRHPMIWPILDFKYESKQFMRPCFDALQRVR